MRRFLAKGYCQTLCKMRLLQMDAAARRRSVSHRQKHCVLLQLTWKCQLISSRRWHCAWPPNSSRFELWLVQACCCASGEDSLDDATVWKKLPNLMRAYINSAKPTDQRSTYAFSCSPFTRPIHVSITFWLLPSSNINILVYNYSYLFLDISSVDAHSSENPNE